MELAELRRERRALAAAVQLHQTTIERFAAPERSWFLFNLSELEKGVKDPPGGRPGHLTSSASCFESLADTDLANGRLPKEQQERVAEFARSSLKADPSAWKSEGAAYVYCRVRALPAVLRFSESFDIATGRRAKRLLEEAWSTVRLADPSGLAEHQLYRGKKRQKDKLDAAEEERYPANAFHTYWGLKSLAIYRARREEGARLPKLADDLEGKKELARAWALRELGDPDGANQGGGGAC